MSNFLENYGKAIFVLVLIAILIAFASPLGIKIKEYTLARVDNLKQTSDDLIAGKPKVDSNEPKEVTDIYAILYSDGELDLSSKEIVPEKGREVIRQWEKDTSYLYAWASTTYRKEVKKVKILDSIKPKTCEKMFDGCLNLTTLINFDKLYTSEVNNFSFMFDDCTSLTDISQLQNWDVSKGTNFKGMFYNCTSLKDISALKNWNVSNGTDFGSMFINCKSLYDATCLNNWNVKDSARKTNMFKTTYGTIKNTLVFNENEVNGILYSDGELVLSHFKIKPTKEITEQWEKDTSYLYAWASTTYRKEVKKVKILDSIKPKTCEKMFDGCLNLTTLINFDKLYTSEVNNFSFMFDDCTSLTDISQLQNWDVSKGTNFKGMFYNCTSLKDISALKNWNVSNGTDFGSMFINCKSLYDATCLNNWNVKDSARKTNMFSNTNITTFPSWYK